MESGTLVVRVTDSDYPPTLTRVLDGTVYHPRPQDKGENGWYFFLALPAGIYRDDRGRESLVYFPGESPRRMRKGTK